MFVTSLNVITSPAHRKCLEQAYCKQANVGRICPVSACGRLDYHRKTFLRQPTIGELFSSSSHIFDPLKPNDAYICRTAPLTSRRYILYIYSTHIGTAYFNHAANSPFFPLQNAVYFIILHCLVPVLFTF